MTPSLNFSLPPPFYEMGAVKFQEFCAELMAEDQIYENPNVYGRNGQEQRGIDIEAPLRGKPELHVGQCKAWSEPSPQEIQKATQEFLPHLKFWQKHGLKKFILLIGCSVDDKKSQDQLREEKEKFRELGVDYEYWDARILKRKLRPYRHIVRNYCEPAELWANFICGNETTSMDPSTQAGLNAVLARHGTLVLELSDARNKELAAILELWEAGSTQKALERTREFTQSQTWPELASGVRAKSLRIQAALILANKGNTAEARQILEQAKALEPNSCLALAAAVVRSESGVWAGLDVLKNPEGLDAWNVRLGLLLEAGKPDLVLAELPKVPVKGGKNPNTAWLEGVALLCLRHTEQARQVVEDALSNHPRSFKLQMAMAMVSYASGISPVFPCWGHLTWPVPPPWYLIKHDNGSRKQRADAAAEFERLAASMAGDDRLEILSWRLACLANEPSLQAEAGLLCASLLKESPGFVPALVWAQERGFGLDKTRSIAVLKTRIGSSTVELDEILALFSLLSQVEGLPTAEKLLDDQRGAFAKTGNLHIWRAHKVQCLAFREEKEAALKLVDEETEPLRKRQVRLALLGFLTRKKGEHESKAAECESEFRRAGDGDALFTCCIERRAENNWSFIADYAEQLVRLVATDAALRLAAEGALLARRPELTLKLLQEHVDLCPDSTLPPDLQRIKGEALRQLGHLSKAIESVEKAASVSPDLHTLMQLFRLRRSQGDLVGSAETAKHFLPLADVPPQFLTEEVAPTIRRVDPELTRRIVIKAKQSLTKDSPVELLVAQQAEKVGLAYFTNELFGKLASWAQKKVQGIEMVDVRRMGEIFRQNAESWAQTLQNYRRGLIPVHFLCFNFHVFLTRWFLQRPRAAVDEGYPLRDLPTLTRHGALAGEQPVQFDPNQELFLDITSLLLLHGLGLLEAIEAAFPKIAVPARLTTWLQLEADKLQPGQPKMVAAQRRALQLIDAGKITEWSPSPDFPNPTDGWAARMGSLWYERLTDVRAHGGLLVDFMPLLANRPEMEPVVLPDAEASHVIGEAEIITGLEALGGISSADAEAARKKLGSPIKATRQLSFVNLAHGIKVHLEVGIAERLAYANVLGPLSEAARVYVSKFEASGWREAEKHGDSDAALLPEIEKLLAHICHRFNTENYRAHECARPFVPEGHVGPLTDSELCVQDTLDYAVTGQGVWCVDDRFLRGLRRDPARPSSDTFDLVHHLFRIGSITEDQLYDFLSKLRAANVRYLPVNDTEVLHHLNQAPVVDGVLRETLHLKRLRRYIAAVLLDTEWLQRPVETPQGQRLLLEMEMPSRFYITIVHALLTIWNDEKSTLDQKTARSNWIWKHLYYDIRLLQELFGPPVAQMSTSEASGHSLGHLFGQAIAIFGQNKAGLRASYFKWLYNECALPILSANPEILSGIAKFLRQLVNESLRELDNFERTTGPKGPEFVGRVLLTGGFLFDLPPVILDALKLTPTELNRFGLVKTGGPSELFGVGVEPNEVWEAVARALNKGYAAILKKGIRLQFTHDNATGRVRITRKGEGLSCSGWLSIPCLMLLANRQTEQLSALQSHSHLFDLNESARQAFFDKLLATAKPAERMGELYENIENSAAWFYYQFEAKAKNVHARKLPLNIAELMPVSVTSLRRHLRIEPKPGTDVEQPWPSAVSALLDQEGLEETVVRLSCLPARLPELVFARLATANKDEMAFLLNHLNGRLQSPLQRLQFLLIALKFGDDLPRFVAQATNDLSKLFDPASGAETAKALITLFKWSHLRLGWCTEARSWSAEARLRAAWVHSGRLHSAIAASGINQNDFSGWISAQSNDISIASISPVNELNWDAASPSAITQASLMISALADFAAQLLPELAAQLDLPALIKKYIPTDEEIPVLFSMWHDSTLRSNVLFSYLGNPWHTGLQLLFDDAQFHLFVSTSPAVSYDQALASLQANPYQPGQWAMINNATNGAPLPPPQAAVMGNIIQNLRISDILQRNISEAAVIINLACDFAVRNRTPSVVEGILDQLFALATEASVKFRGCEVKAGSDSESARIGLAILEGVWGCSMVENDVPATVARFAECLSQLVSRWPAMSQIAQFAVMDLIQHMPLSYQRCYWRAVLTCRAWS